MNKNHLFGILCLTFILIASSSVFSDTADPLEGLLVTITMPSTDADNDAITYDYTFYRNGC